MLDMASPGIQHDSTMIYHLVIQPFANGSGLFLDDLWMTYTHFSIFFPFSNVKFSRG